MSEKNNRDQHDQKHQETQEDRARHSGDLLDYDPEKAQDLIDVEEAAEQASQVSSPNPDDPQHAKKGVPPEQENVSSGFTTGSGMQGGSAKRRKR